MEAKKRNWAQLTQAPQKQKIQKPSKVHHEVRQYSTEYLQKHEVETNKKARDQAVLYMASNPETDFNKVFLIYKFDATPHDIIVQGLLNFAGFDALNQYYKKLAKMIHPDKNTHDLANAVFQKISQAF